MLLIIFPFYKGVLKPIAGLNFIWSGFFGGKSGQGCIVKYINRSRRSRTFVCTKPPQHPICPQALLRCKTDSDLPHTRIIAAIVVPLKAARLL